MLQWAFRNRRTGAITVAQSPNLALGLFLLATVIRWVLRPTGGVATVISGVATGALVWWAADEVLRGVNPWRRLLGAGVLTWVVVRLATR